MRTLAIVCFFSVVVIPLTVSAMDVSDIGFITGHLSMGMSGGDKFGYTIGHELEEEHKDRMKNLDNNMGLGGSLSYRRGISPSILFGASFDYFRSATIAGEGVEDVAQHDSTFEAGSYALYGISLNLQPGISITEQLMIFGKFGLGGYTARLAGVDQELNAALNIGLTVDYFLNDSMGIELAAWKPFFFSEFIYIDEGYTLDLSPLQLTLGVTWIRQ